MVVIARRRNEAVEVHSRTDRRLRISVSEAKGTFTVVNERGMHARPASKLVRLASSFKSEVTIEKDGEIKNAKSVMGVLLLCGAKGTSLTISANGEDAEACVKAIGALIDSGFGEELK
jgi:phosphocarrier protein HPr